VARGWGWQEAIHAEDLKEITDKWLGFLAAGQAGEVEGRLRRFGRSVSMFLFRAEPLRDESGNIVNCMERIRTSMILSAPKLSSVRMKKNFGA